MTDRMNYNINIMQCAIYDFWGLWWLLCHNFRRNDMLDLGNMLLKMTDQT